MAGLLDALNSRDGMFGLALLDAAGARPVRTNIGAGLLQALGTADAFEQTQRQRKLAEEDRAQRQRMQDLQMDQIRSQIGETNAQAEQRKAAIKEAQRKAMEQQRIQQLIRGTFEPTSGVQANAASGVTGPRPEALAAVGQRRPVDYQALIAQGAPADLVKQLAESANYGAPEVARTIEGRDENGRPVTLQFDKQGRQIGQGIAQWKAPEKIDTGGQIGMMDPATMQMLAQFKKTNTPDALLSAETARRGQNMTDARAREGNQIQRDAVGKVEWKQDVNGNWIALPKEVSGSGPVTPIATTAPGKREQQAQNALGIIDQAAQIIDQGTSSYLGAGADQAARVFGIATPGAQGAAKLKALEGALMMAQPRMEGPQSDKDVALYRQMAAQIGDSTVPAASKRAALNEIRALHARYAMPGGAQSAAPGGMPSADAIAAELERRRRAAGGR